MQKPEFGTFLLWLSCRRLHPPKHGSSVCTAWEEQTDVHQVCLPLLKWFNVMWHAMTHSWRNVISSLTVWHVCAPVFLLQSLIQSVFRDEVDATMKYVLSSKKKKSHHLCGCNIYPLQTQFRFRPLEMLPPLHWQCAICTYLLYSTQS